MEFRDVLIRWKRFRSMKIFKNNWENLEREWVTVVCNYFRKLCIFGSEEGGGGGEGEGGGGGQVFYLRFREEIAPFAAAR